MFSAKKLTFCCVFLEAVKLQKSQQLIFHMFCFCRTQRHYGNIMTDPRVFRGRIYAQHIIAIVRINHSFLHFLLHIIYCSTLTATSARPRWDTKTAGNQEKGHRSKTCPGAAKTQDPCTRGGQKAHRCADRWNSQWQSTACKLLVVGVIFIFYCALFSDLYLEELSNVIVAADVECQADEFLDRPATPLFIPAKSGKDAETQIEEGEVGSFTILHIQ